MTTAPTRCGRIIDQNNGFTSYTTDVTVNNVAPTATFGNDRTGRRGARSFHLSLTSPHRMPPPRIATAELPLYAFDRGNGSGWRPSPAQRAPPARTNDNGVRTVGARSRTRTAASAVHRGSPLTTSPRRRRAWCRRPTTRPTGESPRPPSTGATPPTRRALNDTITYRIQVDNDCDFFQAGTRSTRPRARPTSRRRHRPSRTAPTAGSVNAGAARTAARARTARSATSRSSTGMPDPSLSDQHAPTPPTRTNRARCGRLDGQVRRGRSPAEPAAATSRARQHRPRRSSPAITGRHQRHRRATRTPSPRAPARQRRARSG